MDKLAIRTERLLLRRFRNADRKPFAEMNDDARVMEHFVTHMTRAESDAFVDRIEECFRDRGYSLWAVEVSGGDPFIGYAGLWDATFDAPFTPAIEVGWRLAPSAWGYGYATEAANAAIDDGFVRVGLHDVLSFTASVNRRSRAVMERLGMIHDPSGDFEHPHVPVGHPVRAHVLYRFPDLTTRRQQALDAQPGQRDQVQSVGGGTVPAGVEAESVLSSSRGRR